MRIDTGSFDESLSKALSQCALYPEAFPTLILPWGKPGHRLEHKTLRQWQKTFLADLGQQIRARNFDPSGQKGHSTVEPIQFSTSSGHGIGKSALCALLTLFFHACWELSRGLVTANTATQLRTRTWAAVGEWLNMSVLKSRSTYLASQGHLRLYNNANPQAWDVNALTAAKENSENLQGQHSPTASFLIIDEASKAEQAILDAVLGALVGGLGVIIMFGNPTRGSGAFYNSHHRDRALWVTRKIDSRTVEDTDGPMFDAWEQQYGVDSDFFRVRVRGEFPNQAALQFINTQDVRWAQYDIEYTPTRRDPLLYGCDAAHTGPDSSVLIKRHGQQLSPDIRASSEWTIDQFFDVIVSEAMRERPDCIFVDGGGPGAMLPAMLRRSLPSTRIIDVNAASRSPDPLCGNMRAAMWNNMKQAIRAGNLDLPRPEGPTLQYIDQLVDDLTQMEYGYRITDNALMLERKDEARKRGIASPDFGDAVALTYAYPVDHKDPDPPPRGDYGGAIYDGQRIGLAPDLDLRTNARQILTNRNPRWRA